MTDVFVQWKGTNVCLDFTCECGAEGHFDGFFCHALRCPRCERVWKMPSTFDLTLVEDIAAFPSPIVAPTLD